MVEEEITPYVEFKNGQDPALSAENFNSMQIKIKENILSMKTTLLDIYYPVGSYYETSDKEFNPNDSWGGSWNIENDGTVLVSKSDVHTSVFNAEIGTVVGEEKHTQTTEELAPHSHPIKNSYNTEAGYQGILRNNSNDGFSSGFIGTTGEGKPFNIVQPSKVINRWHRIA